MIGCSTTEPQLQKAKFVTCPNNSGSGCFVLNSITGELYWTDLKNDQLKLLGRVPEKSEAFVRYTTSENNAGGGLFITNIFSGKSWWTNGKEWKELGEPKPKQLKL